MENLKSPMTQNVFNILRNVIDPELGVNIVDLGLVYDVRYKDGGMIVIMTLSSPSCPLGEVIFMQVVEVLEQHYPDWSIKVDLVWQPEWNPKMISSEGKQLLGMS